MIGTGSHTVVVKSQHIPAAWTFRLDRLGPRDYGPMSVAAGNSAWPIATAVAAVVLGTSRRALDAATDLVKVKRDDGTKSPLRENTHVQRQLMSAEGACGAEPPFTHRYPDRTVDRQCPRRDNRDRDHRVSLRHRWYLDRTRRGDFWCVSAGCPDPRQPYRRRREQTRTCGTDAVRPARKQLLGLIPRFWVTSECTPITLDLVVRAQA